MEESTPEDIKSPTWDIIALQMAEDGQVSFHVLIFFLRYFSNFRTKKVWVRPKVVDA